MTMKFSESYVRDTLGKQEQAIAKEYARRQHDERFEMDIYESGMQFNAANIKAAEIRYPSWEAAKAAASKK